MSEHMAPHLAQQSLGAAGDLELDVYEAEISTKFFEQYCAWN